MSKQQSSNRSDQPKHVVVGAGPVGSAVARRLVAAGNRVTMVTRSGGGMAGPGVELVALDATNVDALSTVAEDAQAIYNCANPSYSRWEQDWPPLAKSILKAAERTGAVLATTGNLYVYPNPGMSASGEPEPMTSETPLRPSSEKGAVRVAMWQAAKAANDSGLVRATEARASSFIGAEVRDGGHFGTRVVPRLLKAKSVSFIGDPDVVHSWTAIEDVAATLVTIAADSRAFGKAWHVPTAPAVSFRELVSQTCQLAGVDMVSVRRLPRSALTVAGLFIPDLGALKEMMYQHENPFVIDATSFTTEFGQGFTPLSQTLEEVVSAHSG